MLSVIGRAAIRRAGVGGIQRSSVQLERVCIARNPFEATQAHSTREPGFLFSPRRFYATESKAPAKSRAKKASPGKKSAKAKKPVAKRAAAKKKAKPKKVAAKRKAPVKRKLTEAQKEKRAEVRARTNLKELKATALLVTPKPLPASAWQVLFAEYVRGKKAEMGDNFSGVTKIAADAAMRYKNLSPSEREHYNHTANQNKQANDKAFKAWVVSHTPDQIHAANLARMQLKRKQGKANSQKFQRIEDPRIPKRARNARAVFTTERWASGDLKGITMVEGAKTLKDEWDALPASEKKHYEDISSAEKTSYAKAYKDTFHRELPSRPRASASA